MPLENVMDQRIRAVLKVLEDGESKVSVCELYSISRPTLDKWLARYEVLGPLGLADRSRAPLHSKNMVDKDTEEFIAKFRREHTDRGPRKIKAELERDYPDQSWPTASTIGKILDRQGLSVRRKRRRNTEPYTQPFMECTQANDVWCIDFKGWFKTGDGARCDPFTMSDAQTRYLLRCIHVPRTNFESVKPVMEGAFREFGLPRAIRSDNGAPFASRAPLGLSRLSVWWMKLGIVAERIEPGKPEQNGRHERMHLTLKQSTASPPKATLRAQQRAFNAFERDYNFHRPHEALGQQTPATFYRASSRPYPRRTPEIEYPAGMATRKVEVSGDISWNAERIFITEALGGEQVGIDSIDQRYHRVYFDRLHLGILDTKEGILLRGKAEARALRRMGIDGVD